MGMDSNMDNTIQEIHQAVVRIENDHGMKLEALFDAVDSIDRRLIRVEARLDDTVDQMKGLNALVGLLQSIARDHEDRIVRLEN